MSAPDWIVIGKIGRPHGVRGEVNLYLFNPDSRVLRAGMKVQLRAPGSALHEAEIQSVRMAADAALVRFRGIEQREQVAPFTNQEVLVPYASLPRLEDGEFYHVDLVDLIVWGRQEASEEAVALGPVVRVFETGANDVLVVGTPCGQEFFVPMTEDAIEQIDMTGRRIQLAPLAAWAPDDVTLAGLLSPPRKATAPAPKAPEGSTPGDA